MERVFVHIAADAVGVHIVAGPADIGVVDDALVVWVGCFHLVLIGFVIGDGVVVLSFWRIVFATSQLIPWVVGQSVAVGIVTHHHYARFATST